MVTAEEMARAEGYAAGQQDQVLRTRDEIDVAYQRGFDDGGTGKAAHVLLGVVLGSLGTAGWAILFLA